jgi:hypothetical protein
MYAGLGISFRFSDLGFMGLITVIMIDSVVFILSQAPKFYIPTQKIFSAIL